MRKLTFFALLLIAGASVFTSCKKDEDTSPAPTVAFTNNVSAFEIDFATQPDPYTLTFAVTVTAEGEISTFTAKKKISGTTTNITPAPADFAGKTSYTYNYTGTFTAADTYPVELTFAVMDKSDQMTEKTFTVTKKVASANTPFATNQTGMFYHIAGSLQGAWDLDGDALVSSGGTASTKSMKNNDGAGSTFTGSWTSDPANGTQYVKTTTAYASVYQENAVTLYAAGTAASTVTNPAANDVYIAKKGSTYYVISITTVSPTDNTCACGNTGKISFSYKK